VTTDHNTAELRATITEIKSGREATFVDLQWPCLARILDFDLDLLGNTILAEPSHLTRRGWVLVRGSVKLGVGDTIGMSARASRGKKAGDDVHGAQDD